MSLRIELLTPEKETAWDSFVERCPEATLFHKPGWIRVIKRTFGHPTYFVAALNGNHIEGVLPLVHVRSRLFGNALISNAFCVAGGPAAATREARDALTRHAGRLLDETGADYVEFRDSPAPIDGWTRRADLYATFSRPIEGEADANLKQIPRKQRAVVRKALDDERLAWRIDNDPERFYRLFALSLRNHGTPVLPRRYFTALLDTFGAAVEILTVTAAGSPVSSVLSFKFRDAILPYYTGSTAEARLLGANDYMYWQVMRRAVEEGARVFDFGRSRVGTGAYRFKKNWGFEPRPVASDYLLRNGAELPNLNPQNPKYARFVQVWQRLPLPVANLLGPMIVRNIG